MTRDSAFPKWSDVEATDFFQQLDNDKKLRVLDGWFGKLKERSLASGQWDTPTEKGDDVAAEERRKIIGRTIQFDPTELQTAANVITQKESMFGGVGGAGSLRQQPFDKYNPQEITGSDTGNVMAAAVERNMLRYGMTAPGGGNPQGMAFAAMAPFTRENMPVAEQEYEAENAAEREARNTYAKLVNSKADPDVRKAFVDAADKISQLNRKQAEAIVLNGRVVVHPDNSLDQDAYADAVSSLTEATPLQKQRALDEFPALREQQGKQLADVLRKNDEGFRQFEATVAGTDAEKVAAYREKIGTFGALGKQIYSGITDSFWRSAVQPFVGAYAGGLAASDEQNGTPSQSTKDAVAAAQSINKGLSDASEYRAALGGSLPLVGDPGELISATGSVVPTLAIGGGLYGFRKMAGGPILRGIEESLINTRGVSPAVASRAARMSFNQSLSNLGFNASVVTSGIQSYGGTFIDAYESYLSQNMERGAGVLSEDEMMQDALNRAQIPAIASGISTAITTRAFGKTGAESIFAAIKTKGWRDVVKNFFEGVISEAPEETIDQFNQGLISLATYRPQATIGEIVSEAVTAGIYGGLIGGGVSGLRSAIHETAKTILNRRADQAEKSGSPMTANVLRQRAEQVGPEVDREQAERAAEAADRAVESILAEQEKAETAGETPVVEGGAVIPAEEPKKEEPTRTRSQTPSEKLIPLATEPVEPLLNYEQAKAEGMSRQEYLDYQEEWNSKYARSHNEDGTPKVPTLQDEVWQDIQKSGQFTADADPRGENLLAAIGTTTELDGFTAVKNLLNDGWNWDSEQLRFVNPANPEETPAQGLQRLYSGEQAGVTTAPEGQPTVAPTAEEAAASSGRNISNPLTPDTASTTVIAPQQPEVAPAADTTIIPPAQLPTQSQPEIAPPAQLPTQSQPEIAPPAQPQTAPTPKPEAKPEEKTETADSLIEKGILVRQPDGRVELSEKLVDQLPPEDVRKFSKIAIAYNEDPNNREMDKTFSDAVEGLVKEKQDLIAERTAQLLEDERKRAGNQIAGETAPKITFKEALGSLLARSQSQPTVRRLIADNPELTDADLQTVATNLFLELAGSKKFDPTKRSLGSAFVEKFGYRLSNYVTRDKDFRQRKQEQNRGESLDSEDSGKKPLSDKIVEDTEANEKPATQEEGRGAKQAQKTMSEVRKDARRLLTSELKDKTPAYREAVRMLLAEDQKLSALIGQERGGAAQNPKKLTDAEREEAGKILSDRREELRNFVADAVAKASLLNTDETVVLTRDLAMKIADELAKSGVNSQRAVEGTAVTTGVNKDVVRKVKSWLLGNAAVTTDQDFPVTPFATAGMTKEKMDNTVLDNLDLIEKGYADRFLGVGERVSRGFPEPEWNASNAKDIREIRTDKKIRLVFAKDVEAAKARLRPLLESPVPVEAKDITNDGYRDLLTIGIDLYENGAKKLAEFTEKLAQAVGDWVRKVAGKIFGDIRKLEVATTNLRDSWLSNVLVAEKLFTAKVRSEPDGKAFVTALQSIGLPKTLLDLIPASDARSAGSSYAAIVRLLNNTDNKAAMAELIKKNPKATATQIKDAIKAFRASSYILTAADSLGFKASFEVAPTSNPSASSTSVRYSELLDKSVPDAVAEQTFALILNPTQMLESIARRGTVGNLNNVRRSIARAANEELIHAADVSNAYNEWKAAGKPGFFGDFADERAAKILNDMKTVSDSLESKNPKVSKAIKQSLADSINLYGGGNRVTANSVFNYLNVWASPQEKTVAMSEFVRQMIQLKETGVLSEEGFLYKSGEVTPDMAKDALLRDTLMRAISNVFEWFKKTAKRFLDALKSAESGTFGKEIEQELGEVSKLYEGATQFASEFNFDAIKPGSERGINIEVAPNPDDKIASRRWDSLSKEEKAKVTKDLADKYLPQLLKQLEMRGDIRVETGGYAGTVNPSIFVAFGADVTFDEMQQFATSAGVVMQQKEVVVFDENDTTGDGQVSNFRVTPQAASIARGSLDIDEFYNAIREAFPAAEGFSGRSGSLVFANFSEFDDATFATKLEDAVSAAAKKTGFSADITPAQFRSVLIGDLKNKLKTTEFYGQLSDATAGTKQGSGNVEQTKTGRNAARWQGSPSALSDLFVKDFLDRTGGRDLQAEGDAGVREDVEDGGGGTVQLGIADKGLGLSAPRKGTFQLFKDKWATLTHWSSSETLKQTDPKKYGTYGAGEERARKRDYPKDWVNRTFAAYGKYTREPMIGDNRYTLRVDGNKIYDFNKDPEDLWPSSDELRKRGYAPFDQAAANTLYERKIRDAGYAGYVNSRVNVVALFDKAPATKIEPGNKPVRLAAASPESSEEPANASKLSPKEGEDHLVSELKRQVGDNAKIVVEDSTAQRGGNSPAFVDWDANGNPTVYVSREHIDRLLKGRGRSSAAAALTKIADEEVDHIATVKAVGWEKIKALAESMGISEREAVAKKYLNRSNYNSDAEYENAVKRMAGTADGMTAEEKDNALKILGAEHLRQVGQKARSGETTEDVYQHFNDPGFIQTVLNYLSKLAEQIKTRLALGFDPELQRIIENINSVRRELANLPAVSDQAKADLRATGITDNQAKQLLNLSESQTPQTFGDKERKTTKSLLRALIAQNDDVARRLRERTYVPDFYEEDNYVAESYIRSLIDEGMDLESIVDSLKGKTPPSGLGDTPFILAKAQLTKKLFNAARTLQETAFKEGNTDKLALARYLNDLRERASADNQEVATSYGQGLRAYREANDILDPFGALRALNGGLAKLHKNVIGSDAAMRALFVRLQNAVESGSSEALKEVTDLISKLVINTSQGTVQQKKLLLDVVKALYQIYGDKTPTRGKQAELGMPVMERYVQDLSQKISNLLLSDSKLTATANGPVLQLVANQIKGVVQSAIRSELKKAAEDELNETLTEEQIADRLAKAKDEQTQKILDRLSQSILTRDWAGKALDQTRRQIMRDIDTRRAEGKPVALTDKQVEALNKMTLGDVLADDGVLKVVRDSLNFREEIRKHITSQDASRETLVNFLLNKFNVPKGTAEAVADAIRLAYKKNVQSALKAEAERTIADSNATPKEKTVAKSAAQNILELANMGAFSDEAFYNAVAKQFKLPQFDEAYSKMVEQEADRIQRMPEGSDARAEAAKRLLAQISKKHIDTLKSQDRRAWAHLYFLEVPIAVWQAGVLSGVPTQAINISMSNLHVLMRSLSNAAGYALADKGASFSDRMAYFADAIIGYLGAMGFFTNKNLPSFVKTAWQKGIATGSTRFRNEKADTFGVLERTSIPLLTLHKYVGRIMLAADAGNASIASEVRSRMALRYAMSTGQLNANKELFEELLSPSTTSIQTARNQALQEAQAGLFDPSAIDLAGLKGKSKEDYIKKMRDIAVNNRIIELVEQRRFDLMPDLKRQARNSAEEWTFNSDPKGMLGRILGGAIGDLNRNVGVTRFVFSFMNTLANLLNAALDFSPVGVARAYNVSPSRFLLPSDSQFRWDVDQEGNSRPIQVGSPQYYEKLAVGLAGSLTWTALAMLVAAGLKREKEGEEPYFAVYGEGPPNKAERQQLEGSGWQPSTVKIGSLRMRFTDLPWFNLPLSILGTVSDVIRYERGDDKTWADTAWAAAVGAFGSITSKNLFQGASNFFKLFTGDPNQTQSGLKQITSGIVGGYTNPALLRWIRSTADVGADGMVKKLDYSTTEGWLYSMVPLSLGYDKAAIDYRGKEIKDYPWTATARRFGVIDPRPLNEADGIIVEAGLRIPGANKNTELVLPTKDGGTGQITVGRHGDIWRAYQLYRGEFIDQTITTETATQLAASAKQNRDDVQSTLSHKLSPAANDYAKAKVQQDIASGKLKNPLTK